MGRTAEFDGTASGSGDKGEITLEELSSSGMGSKREFSHEDISSQIIEEDEDEYKEEEKEEQGGSKYSYSRPPPHLLPLHQPRHHEPQIIGNPLLICLTHGSLWPLSSCKMQGVLLTLNVFETEFVWE